jgi:hypothetical protein
VSPIPEWRTPDHGLTLSQQFQYADRTDARRMRRARTRLLV